MKAFGKSGIRKMTVVLAAFVALLTAYVLTLPAITVTQDAARPEAGFYIDGQQNTADAADAAGGSMAVGAALSISASVDVNLGIPVPNTSRSDAPDTTSSSSNTNASTLDTPDTPAYPAQDLRQTADLGDGLTLEVRVEAGEGVLPEGTALRLDAIPDPATIDLMKAEAADKANMPADATGVIATDISFVGPDGSAVEPRGKVVVSLTCPVIGPDTQAAIAHVKYAKHPEDPDGSDGRDRADIVELRDLDGRDTVERSVEQHTVYFEATDFSPYGIVYLLPAEPADASQPADAVPDGAHPDASASMPAQSFTAEVEAADGSAVTVTVEADEGAFPEGATMSITPVEDAAVIDAAKAEAADKTPMDDDKAMRALAFDITFADADGNAVEPARPVRVSMATRAIADRDQLTVVHVDDDRSAEVVPADAVAADQGSVAFDAASFSVYALVYTVDFHWEVDDRVYDFSLPGGGFVSLEHVVELLGVANTTAYTENGSESAENGAENASDNAGEDSDINNTSAYSAAVLNTLEISEETRKFVADVESVEFSSPELVWVGKAESDSTVGGLKEANGLDCEYSVDLTKEQIAEINAQTVEAGDWALISMQPFDTEESLTVTMKNGDQWTVKVTDAQINNTSRIVTLHFVDENGNPLEGFTFNGQEITGSTFDVTADWASALSSDTINLADFTKSGYTLSNTHKSTWEDINDSNDSYRHSIIGNELKWNNGTIQYRLFYTNHDKAGSWWFDAGKEPKRDTSHWQYSNGSDPSDHTTVSDNDKNPYDYYLVYSPVPGSSGTSGHTSSGDEIDEIGKSKTLTPNGDGTYTMDLSVTTHAAGHEENKGINLIIVFDTSSSMRRSVNNASTQYEMEEFKTHSDSRFMQARNALNTFLANLCPSDNATSNLVQLALVDFNYRANTHSFGNGYWTNSASTFISTLDGLSCPSGTNWAEALYTARTVAATADDDPTYVLLMTDGAPSQYWDPSSMSSYFVSGEGCYLGARDEGRDVVNDGLELYGVFSFGDQDDENNAYLSELVDYAYNANVRDNHSYYASNPEKLTAALNSVFGILNEKVAHTAVNYQDGIALDTTSTALSANVNGTLGSVTYSKTGGTSSDYTVKADGSGNATFTIGDTTYTGTVNNAFPYTKISGSTGTGSGITTEQATAQVYQCTVGEGESAVIYTMPIATLETNATTKVGDLNWDLAPLGMLEDGATYTISFVVWPDQEAYDYVADLNNSKMQWNTSTQTPVYASDETTVLYYKNGVDKYPNIVYYPSTGKYAVLTNTMQEVTYYIAGKDSLGSNSETTYTGQFKTNPETPDPMPLTASSSQIEKQWNVERDPGILAQYLYDEEGNSKRLEVGFDVYQGTSATPYTTVSLGWDSTKNQYVWAPGSPLSNVTYGGHTHEIGTRWAEDFAIATGLMLSTERMDALGLDKTAYPLAVYGSKTYYILEEGHDYTIKEHETGTIGYEFDFSAPVYHPMLVDGTLQSVNFAKSGTTVTITGMTDNEAGLGSLKIENTLRGYIHLNKVVVDKNGTQIPEDVTEFEYTVTLNSTTDPGPFKDDHIPWYGISGLYYHDEHGNYYQVEKISNTDNSFRLTDEAGKVFTFTSTAFNVDKAEGQTIAYTDDDVEKTLTLYGNQMTASNEGKTVTGTLKINQNQTLNIANIPVGTTYTITETQTAGYELHGIESNRAVTVNGYTVNGTIIANADNNITYKNKCDVVDITVQKQDMNGKGLEGAVFQLRTVGDDGRSEEPATTIEGIGGLTTVTKQVNGTETAYAGSFETTGAVQTISHLPDGTYRLYEVYVPAGYISTYRYIQFEIKDRVMQNVMTNTGDSSKFTFKAASGSGTTAKLALLQIKNEPGVALPNTGGPGTNLIYLIGLMLMAFAGAGLVMKRKREDAA